MFEEMVWKDCHFKCHAGDGSSTAIRLAEYAARYAFNNIAVLGRM